jgi:AAHS family 4-hydroxybenzoate transporter-like MFS transporter
MDASLSVDADELMNRSRISPVQVLVAVLSGTVLFVDGFDTQTIGFVAPQLVRLWHIPPDLLGYMFSSALVGLMIGYLAIAPLAGRFGNRRVTIACVLGFGILTVISTTASGTYELMAYRLLTGIGLGGAIPPAVALCGEYCPERRRSTFITWMYCGYSLGQIAAGAVSVGLLQRYGWQSVLMVGGVLPVLHGLVMLVLMPESLEHMISHNAPREKIIGIMRRIDRGLVVGPATRITAGLRSAQGAAVGKLFERRRGFGTVMIWAGLFMNLLVFYFVQNWLPTIFVEIGFTTEGAISATATALGGGIFAALLIGPLMDRFGPYRVMTGLFIAGGIFVGSIGMAESFARSLMVVAAFCTGFCVSGIQKSANALAVYFYPTSLRSTGLGWGLGIGRAGAILGPSIAGLMLAAKTGAAAVFYAAFFPMMLGALAMALMGRHYQGKRAEDLVVSPAE